MNSNSFLAIDFETANYNRNSACAVGLVRVENNRIKFCGEYLIKPPSDNFVFTYLHGIDWKQVEYAPTFHQLWPQIKHLFEGIDYCVAHNASFDKSVLNACCNLYKISPPRINFKCTVKIARDKWSIRPTKLNNVCDHFGIRLNHHDAISDTLACSKIMLLSLNQKSLHHSIINTPIPKLISNRKDIEYKTKRIYDGLKDSSDYWIDISSQSKKDQTPLNKLEHQQNNNHHENKESKAWNIIGLLIWAVVLMYILKDC